tara:strand:+ start:366 stop:518 length:153 start_codon:yes stop_codon:yes gene_type:complete
MFFLNFIIELTIQSVIDDFSAAVADIKPNDLIIKIYEKSRKGMVVEEAVF